MVNSRLRVRVNYRYGGGNSYERTLRTCTLRYHEHRSSSRIEIRSTVVMEIEIYG